jgi:hypothetical protein
MTAAGIARQADGISIREEKRNRVVGSKREKQIHMWTERKTDREKRVGQTGKRTARQTRK